MKCKNKEFLVFADLYHEDFPNFTYYARNCHLLYNIWDKVEYEITSLY